MSSLNNNINNNHRHINIIEYLFDNYFWDSAFDPILLAGREHHEENILKIREEREAGRNSPGSECQWIHWEGVHRWPDCRHR